MPTTVLQSTVYSRLSLVFLAQGVAQFLQESREKFATEFTENTESFWPRIRTGETRIINVRSMFISWLEIGPCRSLARVSALSGWRIAYAALGSLASFLPWS